MTLWQRFKRWWYGPTEQDGFDNAAEWERSGVYTRVALYLLSFDDPDDSAFARGIRRYLRETEPGTKALNRMGEAHDH